ncbi:uncharacterized protein RCC_10699 [Ramularia collo-cygni]|uniref:Uncharacterized protein n=1 Tax=Ramularia collo-cygni TaxID=112498 RepID=A0A2D3VD27_9PEZI|nr:uncharacterized protein RCC_10699 [Ramularia collo-cygni]CZT24970.1 uncharacterized protein RCC_10699 [Ramularia collo-cygni]
MSRKRLADWDLPTPESPSRKRQRFVPKPTASLPRKRYPKHKDSRVGEDFHSVPYPLTLLPKTSWQAFNQGEADGVCASCGKAREASAHQRKLFLVAERLSWEQGTVGYSSRSQNEEILWACNAELGIFQPADLAVEDDEVVIGGRRSKDDVLYPYRSEAEVEFAMRLIATAEVLSEASWTLWKGMVEKMVKMMKTTQAGASLTDSLHPDVVCASPRRSPRKNGKQAMHSLLTPPSSNLEGSSVASKGPSPTLSYDTLQNFYSLLDKIERTSPIGARFLEAYADRLHAETCHGCWFAGIAVAGEEDELILPTRSSPRSSRRQSLFPGSSAYDPARYSSPRTTPRSRPRGEG